MQQFFGRKYNFKYSVMSFCLIKLGEKLFQIGLGLKLSVVCDQNQFQNYTSNIKISTL